MALRLGGAPFTVMLTPELNQALKDQCDLISHVMLGGLVNQPAQALAKKLVEITPEGLNHVFYGDSGSVGIEIAIKMAIQYWHNRGRPNKSHIVAFKKSYHGDTTGCMSVCDPVEGMHHLFQGVLAQQFFVEAPVGGFDATEQTVVEHLAELERLLTSHADNIAAVIIEPLMQAAGGYNFYSPLYLKQLRQLCNDYQVLLIIDEVATGFGRTGTLFATEQAGICPDIMVLAKGLTAGYIGHSATLASTDIFNAFYDDNPDRAFMHGPTFMGNPLACAVALKGIEIFQREDYLSRIKRIEQQCKDVLLPLEHPDIVDTRVLGATGVIEVTNPKSLIGFQSFAVERGVWLRPFERYLYTMPPYVISDTELDQVLACMVAWFDR